MKINRKERVQLKNNPLVEVIIQIQFPRSMEIDSTMPVQFHKSIMDDFPIFEKQESFYVDLKLGPDSKPLLPTQEKAPNVYFFKNVENSRRVSLSSQFLALSIDKYENWKEFSNLFESAFQKLKDIYQVPILNRIGLRYKNIISRSSLGLIDTPWSKLINKNVLGPFLIDGMFENETSSESSLIASNSLTNLKLDDYSLIIQTGFIDNVETREKCFVIDNDFFQQDIIQTNNLDIGKSLEVLYGDSASAFRYIVSDKLFESFKSK